MVAYKDSVVPWDSLWGKGSISQFHESCLVVGRRFDDEKVWLKEVIISISLRKE